MGPISGTITSESKLLCRPDLRGLHPEGILTGTRRPERMQYTLPVTGSITTKTAVVDHM